MKRTTVTATLAFLAIGLTGCGGIAGSWTLHETDQENFPISQVTLGDDGTYTALSAYGEQEHKSGGKYTFEDGKLTFTSADGKERVYDAKLTGFGDKLEVASMEGENKVVATMKRD